MNAGKRVIAAALFLALLAGTMCGLDWLFRLKAADGCYAAQMFYKQEKNTIDVLCLGSSHTYTNINPAVLWDEYGIASYDMAGSNQPLWNSYYYFKEALKYQKPELAVLDVYRAIETEDYQDSARTAMNTFGLRYSRDYLENVKVSLFPTESYADYLLRFPVYHSRYQKLKERDFKRYNGDANGSNYKGFNLNCVSTISFGAFPDISGVKEVGAMTDKSREYLEKIIVLAQEEEIPLLLVAAPYIGGVTEDKKIYNQVELIAEAYGVEFIDFNEHYDEMGLDAEGDFAEVFHLNYYGSEKYTRYLGEHIVKNYEVSDRRGDPGYDSWEANARFYEQHAANVDLAKTTDKKEYFRKLFSRGGRYTICMNVAGDCSGDAADISRLLSDYEVDMEQNSTWVFCGGELVYAMPLDSQMKEDDFFYQDLGEDSLSVVTKMQHSEIAGSYPYKTISLEGTHCDAVGRGVNILVYDNEFHAIVDNVGLDADDGYRFKRY